MISAISPAMCGVHSNYNVNFGQLRPQNQGSKCYNHLTDSQNPSFGNSRRLTIITLLAGAITGFFSPWAINAATSNWTKLTEDSQIKQARKICAELPETNNIKCVFSCGMLDKPLFSNEEVASRVLKNCSKVVVKGALK